MDSKSLAIGNITGYCISLSGDHQKTSVALKLMQEDGEALKLASDDDVSDEKLCAICEVLNLL